MTNRTNWTKLTNRSKLTSWTKLSIPAIFFLAALVLCGTASAQTDVAASLYGAFSGTTSGNGIVQSPSNSAGGLLELRHIDNPLIGYDVTYSYNRDNQSYKSSVSTPPCSTNGCLGPTSQSVSANAHELTADWVVSLHGANLRPFALAGVGVLFNQPAGNQSDTSSSTKGVFVYGAGIDWGLLPHIGLRFQYRGNLYKAPNLTQIFTSTGAFTHTSEPMLGVYFRL